MSPNEAILFLSDPSFPERGKNLSHRRVIRLSNRIKRDGKECPAIYRGGALDLHTNGPTTNEEVLI